MILLLSFFLISFNIVDRLASPFYYEDYTEQYQTNSVKNKKNDTKETIFIIFIATIFIILMPSSPRYSRYRYRDPEFAKKIDTLGTVIAETAVKIFQKTQEKKFFKFSEEDLINKEIEIKQMLNENNINIQDIISFAQSAVEELFKYLAKKENQFEKISTESLYKKISDPQLSPLTHSLTYNITKIYLVNFRYSIYEKAFSVYIKYTNSNLKEEKGIFITFIEDNGFKISSIEREGESYIMKLDNFYTQQNFTLFNKDIIKQINPQLKIAEIFYEIYTITWKDNLKPRMNIFSNEVIYSKILTALENREEQKLNFKISKLKLSNIEIINIREDYSSLSLKIIARIVFIISGIFSKNGILLVNEEEKICDEIWEFEIKDKKIFLCDIIKKEGKIQPNPLQLEWYI
ncbi:MAG: hypothetical protein N2Z20_05075 [Elusimicrobiales bacterium]|nr:hypothetical protein [Elusimicrobiales bacterium]